MLIKGKTNIKRYVLFLLEVTKMVKKKIINFKFKYNIQHPFTKKYRTETPLLVVLVFIVLLLNNGCTDVRGWVVSGDAERKTWSVEGGKLCEQVGILYVSGFVIFEREMNSRNRE